MLIRFFTFLGFHFDLLMYSMNRNAVSVVLNICRHNDLPFKTGSMEAVEGCSRWSANLCHASLLKTCLKSDYGAYSIGRGPLPPECQTEP